MTSKQLELNFWYKVTFKSSMQVCERGDDPHGGVIKQQQSNRREMKQLEHRKLEWHSVERIPPPG